MQAIEQFTQKLKILARDDLNLWTEDSLYNSEDYLSDENENYNELNYSINGIDLNTIFKMQKRGVAEGLAQGIKDGIRGSTVEQKLKQIE